MQLLPGNEGRLRMPLIFLLAEEDRESFFVFGLLYLLLLLLLGFAPFAANFCLVQNFFVCVSALQKQKFEETHFLFL